MTAPQRFDTLDAMRGLAALAVMLDHFTQHNGGLILFPSSPLAVDLFFCLSGFVIAHAYQQRIANELSFWGFLRLRLIRLWPAWLMGCTLGLPVLLAKLLVGHSDLSPGGFVAATTLNLVFLPYLGFHITEVFTSRDVGDIFPLNDPGWSLFFEFFANALFFMLIARGRPQLSIVVALAGVLFLVAVKVFGESPGWNIHNVLGGLPRVGFGFLAGVLLYQWRDRLILLPKIKTIWLLLALAALMSVPHFRLHTYYWFGVSMLVVPLLVALGSRCELAGGGRAQNWARQAGALSYPLYCLHFPLVMLLSLFYDQAPFWAQMLFAAASLGLAALALRAERPFSLWIARHLPA